MATLFVMYELLHRHCKWCRSPLNWSTEEGANTSNRAFFQWLPEHFRINWNSISVKNLHCNRQDWRWLNYKKNKRKTGTVLNCETNARHVCFNYFQSCLNFTKGLLNLHHSTTVLTPWIYLVTLQNWQTLLLSWHKLDLIRYFLYEK